MLIANLIEATVMIDRAKALEIPKRALKAVEELTASLNIAATAASPETLERLRRGVGISIGTIDIELLGVLRELYPDLDHLKR